MKPDRPVYILELQALPSGFQAPPEKRLARLLKCMLRGYGFRCISARPAPPDTGKATQAGG